MTVCSNDITIRPSDNVTLFAWRNCKMVAPRPIDSCQTTMTENEDGNQSYECLCDKCGCNGQIWTDGKPQKTKNCKVKGSRSAFGNRNELLDDTDKTTNERKKPETTTSHSDANYLGSLNVSVVLMVVFVNFAISKICIHGTDRK
jgi:hypothetical protein